MHDPTGEKTVGGPMTFALQRYSPFAPLAIMPLLHVHTGIEVAIATPWLSDRFLIPPPTLQVLSGVNSELAGNGWSLRPFSPYLRGDFLACRSVYVETGLAPELFIPALGPNEYDVRFRVAFGLSFACPHVPGSVLHHVALVVDYRDRVPLPTDARPAAYFDALSAALQIDVPSILDLMVQPFITLAPHASWTDFAMFGVRLQLGIGERAR